MRRCPPISSCTCPAIGRRAPSTVEDRRRRSRAASPRAPGGPRRWVDGRGWRRPRRSPTLAAAERALRENVPDALAGEQTWPTEEEMAEAEAARRRRGRRQRRNRRGGPTTRRHGSRTRARRRRGRATRSDADGGAERRHWRRGRDAEGASRRMNPTTTRSGSRRRRRRGVRLGAGRGDAQEPGRRPARLGETGDAEAAEEEEWISRMRWRRLCTSRRASASRGTAGSSPSAASPWDPKAAPADTRACSRSKTTSARARAPPRTVGGARRDGGVPVGTYVRLVVEAFPAGRRRRRLLRGVGRVRARVDGGGRGGRGWLRRRARGRPRLGPVGAAAPGP